MKLLLAIFQLLAALVLIPVAWNLRAPFFPGIRDFLLIGITLASLILMAGQILLLRISGSGQKAFRSSIFLGFAAACALLTVALVVEAQFYWSRYKVLEAEPERLEKLGRHFIIGYRKPSDVKNLIRLKAIAGVFITSANVDGKNHDEIQGEIQSLQNIRKEQGLPRLWIATDQEGGAISRLSPPLTRLPLLSEIVERNPDDFRLEKEVRELAAQQGRELSRLGVNLNFAPVVDLNHKIVNPEDRYSRIFERAISGDPTMVTKVAGWYCNGLEESGVRCTLKHFPGLGRVFEDTHLGRANLSASIAELESGDWIPFRTLMNGKAFTMLGHAKLTAIDPEHPVSMSPSVIDGLLRKKWKYDGIMITDNFSMMAVYKSKWGMEKGCIEALNSGVDLVLVSYDPDQYYRIMSALMEADCEGKVDGEMLKKSDRRLSESMTSLRQSERNISCYGQSAQPTE